MSKTTKEYAEEIAENILADNNGIEFQWAQNLCGPNPFNHINEVELFNAVKKALIERIQRIEFYEVYSDAENIA